MSTFVSPGDLGGPVVSGLELRDAIGGSFKDMDEDKREVLVEFPHEKVDTFKTVFGKNAFRDSFAARLPVMCWQHDVRDPIGRAVDAQITPKVNEIRAQFDDFDVVPNSKRAWHQIDSGTITDFSFGFKRAKFERADDLGKGVRRITSAMMPEISPVTIGSIPGAKAVGLREDSMDEQLSLETILRMRESGLITPEVAVTMIREQFPEYREVIKLGGKSDGSRDIKGDDMDADDNSGAGAEDMVDNKTRDWTALDSGTHTATGPNDEVMRAKPDGSWKVWDSNGNHVAEGREDSQEEAKSAADQAVENRADGDWFVPETVNADVLREALTRAYPGIAQVIADVPLTLGIPEGNRADEITGALVLNCRAAIDQAIAWMAGVDESTLPDEVQQSVALTRAAGTNLEALQESLGIRAMDNENEDENEDEENENGSGEVPDGWDTGSWDGDASNYSPDEYKSAALIDTGEGSEDSKDRYALPVKTPSGKYSVSGIAAAAGRLNQVKASPEKKKAAARKLAGLYGQMKKTPPPHVKEMAGDRSDEAVSRLDEILSKRPQPVS